MDKSSLKKLVGKALIICGRDRTAEFLDTIKAGAFSYLTRSGFTWAMADLPLLTQKQEMFVEAQKQVDQIGKQFSLGLLAAEEKHAKIIEIWAEVKDRVTDLARESLAGNVLSPIYAMIQSGARGSWGQTTQMMGTKGLVTSPSGETIEMPVKASFKEGFDVLEYFISTHGTRKGLTDTALRTANAGYLTRRLVDVSQDVVISEADCGVKTGQIVGEEESREINVTLARRVLGRVTAAPVLDPKGEEVVPADTLIDEELHDLIRDRGVKEVNVRTVLNCESLTGICQKCYGWDLSYNTLVQKGSAVGVVAAQSIGEPGTQLTMRTFHTGGVLGADITQGLPRVEELFEARTIKKPALLAPFTGKVRVEEDKTGKTVEVISQDEKTRKSFKIPPSLGLLIGDKDLVTQGQILTEGALDLKDLYRLQGRTAVQKYITKEIQHIYSSQGQDLNDKHIEIILRQLFSRGMVRDPGDTDLIIGSVMEVSEIERASRGLAKGKKSATYERMFLGMTKASLNTSSFLSAASFQQTSQILIKAAITGRIDSLRGLKENVIIGRLIPAGTGYKEYHPESANPQ